MNEQHWFDTARLGMFIHWDHASQQGLEVSWPMVGGVFSLPHAEPVSVEQYESSAETFVPDPNWASQLAELATKASMRYAVFTARHHSGYCMWPTTTTGYAISKSAPKRDLVGEFVTAFREAGLRVGLYFSLSDWHHPGYPAWRDEDSPYRWGEWPRPTPDGWRQFQEDMFAQLRELLTNYGEIDEIWFDGGWERDAEEWDTKGIEALVRELQPAALINDRLPGHGDFATPEQCIPTHPPGGRWEVALTMNRSWGYVPADTAYKSARQLIHALCEAAARGGNLLLNVSPQGDGSLPPEQVERLETLGRWMWSNEPAIIDTRPGLEPWQFYGPSTSRDGVLYLQLVMQPYESITIRGLPINQVRSVQHLATGRELDFETTCPVIALLKEEDPVGEITVDIPPELLDANATVLVLHTGPPPEEGDPGEDSQAEDKDGEPGDT